MRFSTHMPITDRSPRHHLSGRRRTLQGSAFGAVMLMTPQADIVQYGHSRSHHVHPIAQDGLVRHARLVSSRKLVDQFGNHGALDRQCIWSGWSRPHGSEAPQQRGMVCEEELLLCRKGSLYALLSTCQGLLCCDCADAVRISSVDIVLTDQPQGHIFVQRHPEYSLHGTQFEYARS